MKFRFAGGPAPALFFLLLLLSGACSKREAPPPEEGPSPSAGAVPGYPAWPALALLQTGENPLWFELGPQGPGLIEFPSAASLAPYEPWPHARYVAGMRAFEGSLAMAVNRDGFLVLEAAGAADAAASGASGAAGAFLYRIADNGLWDAYTAESFFAWEGKPAVLLYRNDFFLEPSAPPLRPQVRVLDSSSPVPLGASVPALETFPSGGPWEAEIARPGPDGFWYLRMKEKGKARPETAYFKTERLDAGGGAISQGEWRNSGRPEEFRKMPELLAALSEEAAEKFFPGAPESGSFAIKAISPAFEGPRFFSSAPAGGYEGLRLLHAYWRPRAENSGASPGAGDAPRALAVALLPDGRALAASSSASGGRRSAFSLPALPEGFSYTGIALLGDIAVASWEEQQEAFIGAAGFMAMALPAGL